MSDDDRSIGRSDLDACWCCDGLHDAPGPRCPPCREAGCPHFGGDCRSDHQPVRPDGGSVGDSERERVHIDVTGWLKEERPDGSAVIETPNGGIVVGPGEWHRCVDTDSY